MELLYRQHDRFWFRHGCFCAIGTLVDVGYSFDIPCQSIYFCPMTIFSFRDKHLDAVWRGTLGLGVIPATAVFIWRLRMEVGLISLIFHFVIFIHHAGTHAIQKRFYETCQNPVYSRCQTLLEKAFSHLCCLVRLLTKCIVLPVI